MIKQVKNPIIEIHDLNVSFHTKPVLWNVDLTLPKGLIGIIGPNGAGKSTLLKALMGLVTLDSGYIKFWGEEPSKQAKKVSYMPQRGLVDWDFPANVYDVVMMGRYIHMGWLKYPKKIDQLKVKESLEKLGISDLANRPIGELSGGQQQRVFIARALAQEADIYFMDEPFAAIDITTEATILELLQNMVKRGKTIIAVHHNLQSIEKYFTWTVLLNMRAIASGPTTSVFNDDLLQEAYGSQLTILSEAGNLFKKEGIPVREENTSYSK